MSQFSKTDTRRITFLSLLGSAATYSGGDLGFNAYGVATQWLEDMESDGFFEEEVNPSSSGRSGGSARPASRSQSGSGGNARPRGRDGGGFSGNMRDPDGPPTDKQVGFVLNNTDDYTKGELYDMTKSEVSALIDDLKR